MEDSELVDQIYQGNRRAEAELVRRFSERVMMFLRRRGCDREACEDIAQDTFLAVISKLRKQKTNEPDKISRYTLGITRNKYREYIRGIVNSKIETEEQIEIKVAAPRPDPESQHIRRESVRIATELLEGLTQERDRDILRRFHWLQQTKKEILSVYPELTPRDFDRVIHNARNRFKDLAKKRGIKFDAEDFSDDQE